MNQPLITGIGMVPFRSPGRSPATYDQLAASAARLALTDAGIEYDQVQQVYASYVYGDSTAGQRALYALGRTGVPIVNVNNNCSSGASAIFLARANPNAIFRKELAIDDVLGSPRLFLNLTRLQACPPSTGAAAAVICAPGHTSRSAGGRPVTVLGLALGTDTAATFDGSTMDLVGADMSARVARRAYELAGVGPQDAQVVELHDCFAPAEVIFGEAIGLCPAGGSEEFVTGGENTYGGRVVVNPSGGLLSKGHPLGATGVAQCVELVHHLRGSAGERQVAGATIGLQHNVGLGGAAVVGLYAA